MHVGAEHLPQLLVATFVDQVLVELTDGGQVAVRVVDGDLAGAVVLDLEPVVGYLGLGEYRDPDAFELVLHGHVRAVRGDRDRAGERPQGAHGDGALVRMGSEHVVRARVDACYQSGQMVACDRLGGELVGHVTPRR